MYFLAIVMHITKSYVLLEHRSVSIVASLLKLRCFACCSIHQEGGWNNMEGLVDQIPVLSSII